MYTKTRFSPKIILTWTRRELAFFILYSTLICFLYVSMGWNFIDIPWTPIALVGTAVAFMIGFQSNSAYGRIWEARKIWGGIVNTSRTWGMMTKNYISNEHTKNPLDEDSIYAIKKKLVHRHIAWLTTLRYAMRKHKKWENLHKMHSNREWNDEIYVPEVREKLTDVLAQYLEQEEMDYVLSKGNPSTALLYLQSEHITELKNAKMIWEFSYLVLEKILQELFTLQGKTERIKNFPYPKHFSSLTYWFTWMLILLVPIGLVPVFSRIGMDMSADHSQFGTYFVWLMIPFSVIVCWVFHTMMRVSMTSDNPFEGSVNDVPISSISRGIEIDLRQQLNEPNDQIPKPYPEIRDVQL